MKQMKRKCRCWQIDCELCTPSYPDLGASVARYRRIANPTREQRQAHGEAILTAIRQKQQPSIQEVSFRPNCASGTWHTTGEEIIKAVQQQQRAHLSTAANVRKMRTPEEWRDMYQTAMKEKRAN